MTPSSNPTPHDEPGRWQVALAGAVALAVAMGIGRFAFTPLLPMMLDDGVIDLQGASALASMNYLGYLAGALLCTFQPWIWARLPSLPAIDGPAMVRGGLFATGLLTLGMALPWPVAWPALRFAAGLASALVFVFSSGWCLATLAARGAPAMGALMFTGPGAGIVLSGLFATAMVALHWTAATGWLILAVLAWLLSAVVWRTLSSGPGPRAQMMAAPLPTASPAPPASRAELAVLAFAYGLAGFGYIITATFLPVIARAALPDSVWLDLFWPLFGFGVFAGALLSSRLRRGGDWRRWLAAGFGVQALGVATSLWWPSLPGFALGSLLLGLPFTAITFFAMQEVRRLRPHNVAGTTGLLTALYGMGQIVGPPLVAWLLQRSGSTAQGFEWSLTLAAITLVLGALLFLAQMRWWPVAPA